MLPRQNEVAAAAVVVGNLLIMPGEGGQGARGNGTRARKGENKKNRLEIISYSIRARGCCGDGVGCDGYTAHKSHCHRGGQGGRRERMPGAMK